MEIIIDLPEKVYKTICTHLHPRSSEVEEVAFMFAELKEENNERVFVYKDHWLLQPGDFGFQSSYYFDLTDETKAKLIKRAHDLNASIIEFHSHIEQAS